jgi:hypothetical protein
MREHNRERDRRDTEIKREHRDRRDTEIETEKDGRTQQTEIEETPR